ncbi:MAG: hypothetical protein VKK04_04460 [Synechococcales bacterium]|nr:hypothetical protein [Synechococcales bacterium]
MGFVPCESGFAPPALQGRYQRIATPSAAIDALKDRFLVEEVVEDDRYQLKQHNLIRSVALEHLQQLTFADGAEPTDQTDA